MADYDNDPIIRFFRELQKVKDDHRSLVLVANGVFELLIETLVKARCKNGKRITKDSRSYPYAAKLLLLNEGGIISDAWYESLDKFRKLRNRAAHEPFFDVRDSDLCHIKEKEFATIDGFPNYCMTLLSTFWNVHLSVFGPVFAPTIAGPGAQPTVQPDGPVSGGSTG